MSQSLQSAKRSSPEKYFLSERVALLIEERFVRTAVYEAVCDWSVGTNDVSLPPRWKSSHKSLLSVPTKTNMADESSDEELNVQNGYDGEIDIYLAGDSGSDTSESAGNVSA